MKNKILIIDDDPEVRDKISEQLESPNYRVLYASCGTEGLRKIQEEVPDFVICNCSIPGLVSGVLGNAIASSRAAGVRYIFICSEGEEYDMKLRFGLHHSEFLQMPCSGDQILYAVRSRLRKSTTVSRRRRAA